MAHAARILLVVLMVLAEHGMNGTCVPADHGPAECAGPTGGSGVGLSLLQDRRPSITALDPSLLSAEEDTACTASGSDPWATGIHVACCSGMQECLGRHGREWLHYRCKASCSGEVPTPTPTPAPACTAEGEDPWVTGVKMGCCSGLRECLGKHGTQSHHYKCRASCSGAAGPAPAPSGGQGGWATSGTRVGTGWCRAEEPASSWTLRGKCSGGTRLKVLTYNLFWWNLFGRRGGNGGSAGRLIAQNGPYDILGFQECDDVQRVLRDAGLSTTHAHVVGGHATAIAYDRASWELLASGADDVAEDRPEQHYGRRGVGWARLRHKTSGKVVFAANHHGPLPVNTGGQCGGQATAYNMLRIIGRHAQAGDMKLLMGDLNADRNSATQAALLGHMHRVTYDWVDAIFASCEGESAKNLGNGGSDHDAIEAVFQI